MFDSEKKKQIIANLFWKCSKEILKILSTENCPLELIWFLVVIIKNEFGDHSWSFHLGSVGRALVPRHRVRLVARDGVVAFGVRFNHDGTRAAVILACVDSLDN